MRWKLLALAASVICFIICLAFWKDNSSRRTLADGTVLVFSGLKIGRTNVYTHGTFLAKTIGRFAPSRGIRLAVFTLRRPDKTTFTGKEGSEILSFQVHLLSGSPRQQSFESPSFFRKYRLLISGDDDFTFVKEFNGFKNEADGLFAHIWAESFPRDSRHLHFRLEQRDKPQGRDWHEVVTSFDKHLKLSRPMQIHATVAIHQNYQAKFTLQPH